MTIRSTVTTETVQAPAKVTSKPTEEASKGSAAPAPLAAKNKKVRPNPTANEKSKTKASKIEAMLARKSGVTLDQMCEATGWQAHTCRAFMSGLRKKGRIIAREPGKAGKSINRFVPTRAAAKAR